MLFGMNDKRCHLIQFGLKIHFFLSSSKKKANLMTPKANHLETEFREDGSPAQSSSGIIGSDNPFVDTQVVIDAIGTDQPLQESSEDIQESSPQERKRMTANNTLFGYEMPFDIISAAYAAIVATGGRYRIII